MATVEKAEQLLEDLRSTSWEPALKGMHRTTGALYSKEKELFRK